MKAEIISIGTEHLLGQIVDTNAPYIAQKLALLGIDVFRKTTVGDNQERIAKVLKESLERVDLIIITGGLGPTEDDLTKEAVSKVLGKKLKLDKEIFNKIEQRLAYFKKGIKKGAFKQALIPRGAKILNNRIGTAPGILLDKEGKKILILPGVPKEMIVMMDEEVIPYLSQIKDKECIVSRVLKVWGIGESQVEEKIADILKSQSNPTIALLVKREGVCIRITAKFSQDKIKEKIKKTEDLLRNRLGDYIYGVDEETMEKVVGTLLKKKKLIISVAESCTGGLLSHLFTNIPGSSTYYQGGIISYSNDVKSSLLKVPYELIKEKGAVSAEVAKEMAKGVRKICVTDIGIGITGIAGPTGGTLQKPVGLVYIALSTPQGEISRKFLFSGNREDVRWKASQTALDLLRRHLIKKERKKWSLNLK